VLPDRCFPRGSELYEFGSGAVRPTSTNASCDLAACILPLGGRSGHEGEDDEARSSLEMALRRCSVSWPSGSGPFLPGGIRRGSPRGAPGARFRSSLGCTTGRFGFSRGFIDSLRRMKSMTEGLWSTVDDFPGDF